MHACNAAACRPALGSAPQGTHIACLWLVLHPAWPLFSLAAARTQRVSPFPWPSQRSDHSLSIQLLQLSYCSACIQTAPGNVSILPCRSVKPRPQGDGVPGKGNPGRQSSPSQHVDSGFSRHPLYNGWRGRGRGAGARACRALCRRSLAAASRVVSAASTQPLRLAHCGLCIAGPRAVAR
jgi:hypothetical protein